MNMPRIGFPPRYTGFFAGIVTAALAAAASAGTGDYLIVAAEGYVGSAALDQFVAAKSDMGFDVAVYSVPAGTSQTGIKSYIESLWGGPNSPEYILIVGDTSGAISTATTIPHWAGVVSGVDTDLYYACMDGGDDWYPDIAIGRFSVTDPNMLQEVVDKTLFVETGEFSDPNYATRITLLATNDSGSGAEEVHDWVTENYIEPAGFVAQKIYAGSSGDTADVAAAVNAGTLMMVYFGHSNQNGWWAPSFDQDDIRNLSNEGLYGLVFGFSCNTAHFSYNECFGETWLRVADRGAAAYLSASAFIYYHDDPWDESQNLEKFFFKSFFVDDIWEVGPAWNAALYCLLDRYGPTDVTRDHFELFNLLGDPSLRLPGGTPLYIELPDGPPEFLSPDQPTSIRVRILAGSETYQPDSGTLYYRYDDGPFLTVPIIPLRGNLYEALLPSPACGDEPEFYFSASGDEGSTVFNPGYAPVETYTATVAHVTTILADDFETDQGWTVVNDPSLTGGAWERAVPSTDGSYGEPQSDCDGAGFCYVTQNTHHGDVDYGPTTLVSPTFDLSAVNDPILRYSFWLACDDVVPPAQDLLVTELSNDDGGTWVTALEDAAANAWVQRELRVADHITPTAAVKVRFVISDTPNNSKTEAAIDGVWLFNLSCGPGLCAGDLNCDGVVNFDDIDPFVAALGCPGGDPNCWDSTCPWLNGDCNEDSAVDFDDIDPFVARFGANCP